MSRHGYPTRLGCFSDFCHLDSCPNQINVEYLVNKAKQFLFSAHPDLRMALLFLIGVLLRYSSHNTNHFKRYHSAAFAYSQFVSPPPLSICRMFSFLPKPYLSIKWSPQSSLHLELLVPPICFPFLGIYLSYVKWYHMWPWVSGFFHL